MPQWGVREPDDAEKIGQVLSGIAEGRMRTSLLAIQEARRQADEAYIQQVLGRFGETMKPREVTRAVPTTTMETARAAESLETMQPVEARGGRASRDLMKAVGIEPTGGVRQVSETLYPSAGEKSEAIDEAMASLLARATPQSLQTAQVLGGMRPKVDLSTNLEEMLARGQISKDEYKELKGAGRAPVQDQKIGQWVEKATGKIMFKMKKPTGEVYDLPGTEVMPTAGQMGKIDEKIFTDPFDFDEAGHVVGVKGDVTRAMRVKLRTSLENEAINLAKTRVQIQSANQMAALMGQDPDTESLAMVNSYLGSIRERINALTGKSLKKKFEPPFGGPRSRREVEETQEAAAVRRTPITAPAEAKKTKEGARFTFRPKPGTQ